MNPPINSKIWVVALTADHCGNYIVPVMQKWTVESAHSSHFHFAASWKGNYSVGFFENGTTSYSAAMRAFESRKMAYAHKAALAVWCAIQDAVRCVPRKLPPLPTLRAVHKLIVEAENTRKRPSKPSTR